MITTLKEPTKLWMASSGPCAASSVALVGTGVGAVVGVRVGVEVGTAVGAPVGVAVGEAVGLVGVAVGTGVGGSGAIQSGLGLGLGLGGFQSNTEGDKTDDNSTVEILQGEILLNVISCTQHPVYSI